MSKATMTTVIAWLVLSPMLSLAGEPNQEWELVAQPGRSFFVYVSPDGLEDKFFMAQVLNSLVAKDGKGRLVHMMFFDEKRSTPRAFPMTDPQMLHMKAQYNFNPNTGHERFVWIKVKDKTTSPPELQEIEANIRPGYAE